MRTSGAGWRAYAGLTILALAAILVQTRIDQGLAALYIFLGILPLINALFDFGSIGLTRYALRKGTRKVGPWTLLWSFGDLVAALVLFLALGCAGIAAIALVNSIAPEGQIFDMVCLFDSIDDKPCADGTQPAAYWWLYATFASTLLPTVVHLFLASVALGPALLTRAFRARLAGWMDPGREQRLLQLSGVFVLSLWSGLVVTVPVLIGAALWTAVLGPGWLGDTLLWFFRGVHAQVS